MRKYFFLPLLISLLSVSDLFSQNLTDFLSEDEKVVSDMIKNPLQASGRTAFIEGDREIEGSPFFKDEWMSSDLILGDNKRYQNINTRLSLFTGKVHVKMDSAGFTVNVPIKELWFYTGDTGSVKYIFRTGYFNDPELMNTCLQVISDGKIQFLKFRKAIIEEYPVAFENARLRFSFIETYYVYRKNELVKVKLNKDAFIAALPEQKDKLATLINDKKTKFKSESSVGELIDALNKD